MERLPKRRIDENPVLSMRKLASILCLDVAQVEILASEAGRYYRPFDRRKTRGTGKWRHIDNPTGLLKSVQSRIHKKLLVPISLPETVVGGARGRSTIDHAKYHLWQPWIVTLDIKDCFPSISNTRIFDVFRSKLGYSTPVASALTRLTTFQHRLPQGAPTSPTLANLALLDFHAEVDEICCRLNLQHSIYVDDIAISGEKAIQAIPPICSLLESNGFNVSWRKIQVQPRSACQQITGLQVNNGIDISRQKLVELREEIISIANAEYVFSRDLQSIWGKINNIKNISPLAGGSLTDFARQHLPETSIPGGCRRGEIRGCRRYERDHSGADHQALTS